MDRVYASIKETYRQVGELEFDRINPYVESIGYIRHKYPKATITSVKTITENFGSLQVPALIIKYSTNE